MAAGPDPLSSVGNVRVVHRHASAHFKELLGGECLQGGRVMILLVATELLALDDPSLTLHNNHIIKLTEQASGAPAYRYYYPKILVSNSNTLNKGA